MEQPIKKRKQQAMETRQKIFDATMELVREKGADHVQIEDISRRAGISMGLFYNYFANKSDVITAATSRMADSYYLEIEAQHLQHLRGEEKLMAFLHHIAAYHETGLEKAHLKHSYATMLLNSNWRETVTSEERFIYTVLTGCLQEMQADGLLSPTVSAELSARHLTMLVRGTILEYLLSSETFDIIGTLQHLAQMHLTGLKQQKA